mmetsp:Transcript_62677/g.164422  ORF Transcript_62677/g.164422 Transcript_62677/m.164422 type:complete len:276 (-) Transcript_62677:64-891(-)
MARMAAGLRCMQALTAIFAAFIFASHAFVLAPGITAAPRAAGAVSSRTSSSQLRAADGFFSASGAVLAGIGAAVGIALVSSKQAASNGARVIRMRASRTVKGDEEVAPPPPPPFDPAKQVGVTAPLGFFDPLGFSKVGDKEGFRRLRAAEIKHGRVAMMAAAGAVIQHSGRIPIFFDFEQSGVSAAWTGNGKYGMIALALVCGWLETVWWTENDEKEPGDFGDPLGLGIYDRDMRNRELNNGRFAMFAAMGIMLGEALTGKDALEQLGFQPAVFE